MARPGLTPQLNSSLYLPHSDGSAEGPTADAAGPRSVTATCCPVRSVRPMAPLQLWWCSAAATCYTMLLCSLRPVAALDICDVACQRGQRAALQAIFAATGGSNWTVPYGWSAAGDDATINVNGSAAAHCDWAFVTCCYPNHQQYIYPLGGAASCETAYGVVALAFYSNNLVGTLPDVFASFSTSLAYLAFLGKSSFLCRALQKRCVPSKGWCELAYQLFCCS